MTNDKLAIVCVDDERVILNSLKNAIKEASKNTYIVETAEGGADALELVRSLLEEGYEILMMIADYLMPGMRGDELLICVHKLSPGTRKIMLAGYADIEAIDNAIKRANLYRFIAKPWNPDDLKLTVATAVRGYIQEKQLAVLNREQTLSIEKLRDKEMQLAALKDAYERFVPKEFLSLLNKQNIVDIHLGQQIEKEMSILFCDIRGFTTMSEGMTPQDNFNFINAYLSRMEPVIGEHCGFVDKYIGDAIMALFPGGADDAVKAAIAMLQRLAQYNKTRQKSERLPIEIGIGINTGTLMLGTVGGKERMEGTVISDAVNLTARIEGLTKKYGTPMLITEYTYRKLKENSAYRIRMIDHVTVKGKTAPVTVYEVFDGNTDALAGLKLKTLEDFQQGFRCFHGERFQEAVVFFEKVLAINAQDLAAQIYLDNSRRALSLTVQETPRILVVDDAAINISVVRGTLRKQGFNISSAQNGEKALEITRCQKPHLILLDIMMPDMDGYEVCKRLKADEKTRDIPIIFMTALTDVDSKTKGFSLGAVDYVTKPFQREELLARINTHLMIGRLHQQLQLRNVELEINNLELKRKINNSAKERGFG